MDWDLGVGFDYYNYTDGEVGEYYKKLYEKVKHTYTKKSVSMLAKNIKNTEKEGA